MKKIVVIINGSIAEKFLERIEKTYPNDNVYDIVHYDKKISHKKSIIYCHYHEFDPTSYTKLSAVMTKKHIAAYIVMDDQKEAHTVYKNIRTDYKNLSITMLDMWGLDIKDVNLTLIDSDMFIAGKLFSHLPDIPVFAQQVGLGTGDITEVIVPFGSTYAYKHISNIEQKTWKIGAVYRNNQLMLPKPSLMVRPNDTLLLIGQPAILKDVYKAIKSEHGQFPSPYGKNILHIIDMKHTSYEETLKEIEQTIYLNKLLKNKIMFIKIINTDSFEIVNYARSFNLPGVHIDIVYKKYLIKNDIEKDVNKYNSGLIIVNREIFRQKKNRRALFNTKKPVLKLGLEPMTEIDKSAVLLSDNKNLENISSAVFDISSQLSLPINLYNIDHEEKNRVRITEHFENLAEIYSKDIDLHESINNPIRQMQNEEKFLQFMPFEENVVNSSFLDVFFPDVDKLYYFLDEYNQIFIPVL